MPISSHLIKLNISIPLKYQQFINYVTLIIRLIIYCKLLIFEKKLLGLIFFF